MNDTNNVLRRQTYYNVLMPYLLRSITRTMRQKELFYLIVTFHCRFGPFKVTIKRHTLKEDHTTQYYNQHKKRYPFSVLVREGCRFARLFLPGSLSCRWWREQIQQYSCRRRHIFCRHLRPFARRLPRQSFDSWYSLLF